jgi:hypothetical protein
MKIYLFSLLLLPLLLFSGCSAKGGPDELSSGGRSAAYSAVQSDAAFSTRFEAEDMEAQYQESAEQDIVSQNPGAQSAVERRKLVKRANLSVRVENLGTADAAIQALMGQYNAYTASTEIDENSRRYIIRVPSAAYDSFLAALNGMGRMLRRSESAEDVTLRYYDLEGRLATKQELLTTFQSYLGKANNIEEILSVETRIADLQDEIDGTGKELRRLANQVDYATIALDLYGQVASIPYSGPTLRERIIELFGGFSDFVFIVLVILLGIVIYGIPVTVFLTLLFWILFGRIGLLKKLWCLAAGRHIGGKNTVEKETEPEKTGR